MEARDGCSCRSSTLFRRALAVLAIQQIQNKFGAIEIDELDVFLHAAIKWKADFPGTRKDVGIFDGGFIHDVVWTDLRVALDDVQGFTVVIAGSIKP
jgi:hypothetical protein